MTAAAVTVYRGEADQLAAAQEALDRHTTSSATGRCLECGMPGPCARRETAVKLFSRYMRLPRRVPGRSRPELIGAHRVQVRTDGSGGAGWASALDR